MQASIILYSISSTGSLYNDNIRAKLVRSFFNCLLGVDMGKRKKFDCRETLLAMIPEGCERVLDVGCSAGTLSAHLKEAGVEVVGIELDPEMVKKAELVLDKVICANLESDIIEFPENHFDCILCADVIEHLINPDVVLQKLASWLKPSGSIVVSMPNVRYYKLLSNVFFKGSWDYVKSGILDRTHFKFYCRINMLELFNKNCFRVEKEEVNIKAKRLLKIANFLLFGFLKDLLTYQYFFKLVIDDSLHGFVCNRKIDHF